MNCIILGDRSDIAQGLKDHLISDGWYVEGWNRDSHIDPDSASMFSEWDLAIVCVGVVKPVGYFYNLDLDEWENCVRANLVLPFRLLRMIWPLRNRDATVCFMSGSNPQKIMAGYSPYNASKMGLNKLVEQLDFETETKIFALGPGYVKTKIHKATLEAKWPNERIARGDSGTSIDKIYDCLKWCVSQDKSVVGGRNICATDPYGTELAEKLKANPSMYKLRRIE